ncbi:MAG: hypothetical protein LH629_10745 [Ignavibacteria bacterium]|nr:hypothetical protein [Ignavibacteria bacterium]
MDFIKTTQRIQNKRVIVNIPEDFISENVEVIILPLITDDNNFTQEIMKVSEKSFQEWDNKEDEIYDTL